MASGYLGLAVDAFAARNQQNIIYGNPQANGTKQERVIGGFNFAYRLAGDPANVRKPQLWVYGETVHGVRSAELDCSNPATRPPVCGLSPTSLAPGTQVLYLLRNASSLEASAGLRYEFLPLRSGGPHPARLYIEAQAGFLSIAQAGGDIFDAHHIVIGVIAAAGRFAGSHFEAGFGRNDVFLTHRYRRAVADAYLTWSSASLRQKGMAPFLRMRVSSDLSSGADSVQTFFGVSFDLGQLFGN